METNTKIQKHQTDLQLITEQLNANNCNLNVGDIFVIDDHYHEFIKISKIEVRKVVDYAATRDKKKNPSGKQIKVKEVWVYYDCNEDWEGTEWRDYGSDELPEFIKKYGDYKIDKPIPEYTAEAAEVIKSGNYDMYKSSETVNEDEALVNMNSKEGLQVLKQGMDERRKHVELVKRFVNVELNKKRQELEKLRDNLGLIVADFRHKVEKIEKVIYTIELYLGISEQIIQLQEGVKAGADEVIYFRQDVLYMDEEYGDVGHDKQGIDFQEIDVFDKWLCEGKNYLKLIPEQKSIVVFRVRREDKEYYENNPFINAMMNAENHKSYILIRNGDNLYRIWADIQISRLFPRQKELMEIQMEIAEEESGKHKSFRDADKLKKELDNTVLHYKQQILMLQGLLDRTDILHPIPEGLRITSAKCHDEGKVRFIYDDEIKLPDSRKPFWDWHKQINSTLTFGSRVIYNPPSYEQWKRDRYGKAERYDERYNKGTYDHPAWDLPSPPHEGVYSVEKYSKPVSEVVYEDFREKNHFSGKMETCQRRKVDEKGHTVYNNYVKDFFAIRYNPKDEIRNNWDYWDDGHERKNKIAFKIYADDKFILNYDAISLDDINFYINSRVNRRHYLYLMPLLGTVRDLLLKEIEWEKHFVRMVLDESIREFGEKASKHEAEIETAVWGFIKKWKDNIKWKRPISQADDKALKYVKAKVRNFVSKIK